MKRKFWEEDLPFVTGRERGPAGKLFNSFLERFRTDLSITAFPAPSAQALDPAPAPTQSTSSNFPQGSGKFSNLNGKDLQGLIHLS